MKKIILSLSFTAIFSSSLFAAETIVEPGTNTLQAAINLAAAGDTLLLKDGIYKNSGITVDKSLTIKSMVNNTPILIESGPNSIYYDDFNVHGDVDSETDVVLSGLSIQGIEFHLGRDGDVNFTVVESHLTGYPVPFNNQNHLNSLTLIGNDFYSNGWDLNAEYIIAAGNNFYLPSSSTNAHIYLTAEQTSHFIGNKVTSSYFNRPNLLEIRNGLHFVLANRFELDLSQQANNISASTEFFLIKVRDQKASAIIKNNLLKTTLPASLLPDANDPADTTGIDIAGALYVNYSLARGVTFENNTVDFGMDADDIRFYDDQAAVIYLDEPAIIRNNIVVNTSLPLAFFNGEEELISSSVEYNLCDFIGNADCSGNNNLEVDFSEGFVDSADYVLATESTAINAGKPLAVFNDIDGTVNDLGMYGGAFPINQYDVQRQEDRTEPYLYPLFEANKSVTQDGQLSVRVIGLARSK